MADINISDVTNAGGTGTFDVLMAAVGTQVELQYAANRITGSDYANVYLGSIQAALTQSIQFNLQEQLVEAQVAGVLADNLLKAKQLLQVVKQTDVTEREMVEKESTGAKQRTILDTEESIKNYENVILQVDQHNKHVDDLSTSSKQRLLLDEEVESADLQQIILATDEEIKTAQLAEITSATSRAQSELTDKLSTTAKQRILLDEEKATSDAQQLILAKDLLLKAEQIKTTYTDRVVKDKQASKLGLDNAMKQSEAARQSDPTLIYTPKYTEV